LSTVLDTTNKEIEMSKVKITKSWNQLKTMQDNDIKYFWTPGASQPYANSQPSWRDDKCVATVQDFVEAEGFDMLSDSDDGLSYAIEIEYPFNEK